MKDFYKILGLEKNIDKETIKKTFRKLALQYHPDKYSGGSEKFREIREAFEILYDDNRREAYDKNRNNKKEEPKKEEKQTKKPREKKKYETLARNINLTGKVIQILFKNGNFYIFRFEYSFEDETMSMVGMGVFFDEIKRGDNIEIEGDIVYNNDYEEENFKCNKAKRVKSEEEKAKEEQEKKEKKEREEKERREKKEKEEAEIKELIEMLNEESKMDKAINSIKKYYYLNGFSYVAKNIKYSMRKTKGNNKSNNIAFYLIKSLENGWAK